VGHDFCCDFGVRTEDLVLITNGLRGVGTVLDRRYLWRAPAALPAYGRVALRIKRPRATPGYCPPLSLAKCIGRSLKWWL
jgi:hypothetical protein